MNKNKIFLIAITALVLLIISYFIFGSYSSGYRAGKIMKLSNKGVLFKTYEGQLDIGGLESSGSDGAATTVWAFSVKDHNVVENINNAVDNNWRVKLYYKEKYYKLFFFGDTKHFVYKVEKIETNNQEVVEE